MESALIETVLKLATDNQDAKVVKDVLNHPRESIKINILQHACLHIIFQVAFAGQSFVVKKLNESCSNDKDKERLSLEARGFIRLQKLLPNWIPTVYCWDDKMNSLAMEDLSSFSSLRKLLTSGEIDWETIIRVAENVAQMHKATHVNSQPLLFKEVAQEFQNSPSVDSLTGFSKVNLENLESGRWKDRVTNLITIDKFKSIIASMADVAKNKKEVLLHGRLVGESIFINGEVVKLTDGKHYFVGPSSFDVGHLIAQYLISYHEHMLTPENNDWHRKISYQMVDAARDTVNHYQSVMASFHKDGQDHFISEVAAFCGLELIRSALKSTESALKSTESQSKSLEILESGIRLLNAHQRIHDASRLVVIALMLTF